jgi:hypothetical protein
MPGGVAALLLMCLCRMLIADADHDNKIVENVLALQRQCRAGMAELEAELADAAAAGGDAEAAAAIWAEKLVGAERENRRLLEQLDSVHFMLQAQEVKLGPACVLVGFVH